MLKYTAHNLYGFGRLDVLRSFFFSFLSFVRSFCFHSIFPFLSLQQQILLTYIRGKPRPASELFSTQLIYRICSYIAARRDMRPNRTGHKRQKKSIRRSFFVVSTQLSKRQKVARNFSTAMWAGFEPIVRFLIEINIDRRPQ